MPRPPDNYCYSDVRDFPITEIAAAPEPMRFYRNRRPGAWHDSGACLVKGSDNLLVKGFLVHGGLPGENECSSAVCRSEGSTDELDGIIRVGWEHAASQEKLK